MNGISIRDKCRVTSNRDKDTFVGIQCVEGDISIHFPMGYHISEDDKGVRKDVILLFSTLAAHTGRKDSMVLGQAGKFDDVEFPLQSYMYIIQDYLTRGYYQEREVTYGTSKRGKINWNKTIKTQKPYVQDKTVFYLDFVTKNSAIKENELITQIHEFCVYESFERIGWLFTESRPRKPRIKEKKAMFRKVLRDKFSETFNNRNRMLFRHMLAILDFQGDKEADKNYRYGTYRFEYVWEKMIDRVFGIENKNDYFPRTFWNVSGETYANAFLEPDTIMIYGNDVYVLDAKYYKFGITGKVWDLPESTSINKQITYGEYIAEQQKFREKHGMDMKVYNAFLMPFDFRNYKDGTNQSMIRIGQAASNWKDNLKGYEQIQGILIDVKTLMSMNVKQDLEEIEKLAELIALG